MDLKELSKLLAADTLGVCQHFFPNGDRKGQEFYVGSVKGEKGDSCRIHLSGDKAGVWSDFAAGHGGDLIDLWMSVRNVNKGIAVKEIKEYLHIKDSEPDFGKQEFKTPTITGHRRVTNSYLYDRGLTEETIKAFKLAEKTVKFQDGEFDATVFPSFDVTGTKLIRAKYIAYERPNGKKLVMLEPGCKPILFGWHLIPKDARSVCICEGEINTMTLHQYGIPALGLPLGAGKGQPWIEHDYHQLELFDTIYLRMDNDDAGELALQAIAPRLGLHRCKIVHMSKDPNDLLKDEFTKEQIDQFFQDAKYYTPETLKSPSYFLEKAIRLRYPIDEQIGFSPMFKSVQYNGPKITFRPKETSIWTGYNFSGKSTMLKQMILDGITQGETFFIASPEEPGENILNDLCHMAYGVNPSEDMMRTVTKWFEGKIWIYNVLDTVKMKDLLELMEYGIKRHGSTQVILDSIMCIDDVLEESLDSQRKAINQFLSFGKTHGCHNHIVAHPRKPPTEDFPPRPTRFSISGSSKFSDRADNVLGVWRNEKKDAAMRGELDATQNSLDDILKEPSALFSVFKQKWGKRWVGSIGLHFDEDSHQYVDFSGGEPGKPRIYFKG